VPLHSTERVQKSLVWKFEFLVFGNYHHKIYPWREFIMMPTSYSRVLSLSQQHLQTDYFSLPKAFISTPHCDIINLICWASCLCCRRNSEGRQLKENLHKAEIKQEVNECEKGVNVEVIFNWYSEIHLPFTRMIITQFLICRTFVMLIVRRIVARTSNFRRRTPFSTWIRSKCI
jgi:hypothetical protein